MERGGFILVDGLGTDTQSQGYDNNGVPLFSQFGEPMDQDTPVLDDGEGEGFEDGEAEAEAEHLCRQWKEEGHVPKDRRLLHKEDLVLYHSWLSISEDPICGAEQKGQAY
jgi:hypothetical protein